jgi:hypothetical protein
MQHFLIGVLIVAALFVYAPRVLFVALGLLAFTAFWIWPGVGPAGRPEPVASVEDADRYYSAYADAHRYYVAPGATEEKVRAVIKEQEEQILELERHKRVSCAPPIDPAPDATEEKLWAMIKEQEEQILELELGKWDSCGRIGIRSVSR